MTTFPPVPFLFLFFFQRWRLLTLSPYQQDYWNFSSNFPSKVDLGQWQRCPQISDSVDARKGWKPPFLGRFFQVNTWKVDELMISGKWWEFTQTNWGFPQSKKIQKRSKKDEGWKFVKGFNPLILYFRVSRLVHDLKSARYHATWYLRQHEPLRPSKRGALLANKASLQSVHGRWEWGRVNWGSTKGSKSM